ncbi:hypothetical protein ABZX90_28600 [Streptomyces sp. NPDC002935]|uniref:DUF7848 domain-containing protein n=1 Tax=Streptomyces sp. NPDC002935 TaxID=3154545 RepID=UPI00339E242E
MKKEARSYAYPALTPRISVDDLPARRWVECASCIEFQAIEHTTEAEVWAVEHLRHNSHHDRFRIVRQIGWKLTPRAVDSESVTA